MKCDVSKTPTLVDMCVLLLNPNTVHGLSISAINDNAVDARLKINGRTYYRTMTVDARMYDEHVQVLVDRVVRFIESFEE